MVGGSTIEVRDSHPRKAILPSDVMEGGSTIAVRDKHPQKIP